MVIICFLQDSLHLTWGALYKCWIGFVIAKEKLEWEKIDLYAGRIQKLEKELGIELTDFQIGESIESRHYC